MTQVTESRRVVRFGDFQVDLRAGELRKHGVRVRLQEQPFKVLAMLLAKPGEVVTREELRQALWPADTFVDFDHGLNSAINRLREALADSAETPRFVETAARRGYRLIAAVEEVSPATAHEDRMFPELLSGTPTVAAPLATFRRRTLWLVGLASAALLAVVLGANPGGWQQRLFSKHGPTRIQSLAVLPLLNLSGDAQQEYFADGITDALITDLAQISALRVISRTSAMHYKGTKKTLPEIARELHVDAVVEGTVARSGERVRITAQLIDAPTDRHL